MSVETAQGAGFFERARRALYAVPTLHPSSSATGMRISELLGLQWGDIEWAAQIIHLNRTWVYGQIGDGKSEESRKPVPIGRRVTEFLQQWHRETPYAGRNG